MTDANVTTCEMPEVVGMRALTRDLDGWDDAWLVELETTIRPVLKTYEELDNGIHQLDEVRLPIVRYIVVAHNEVHEHFEETVVYPAFASGEPRYLGEEPVPIAGGDSCTHVDALHDLTARYVGLECTIEGERCPYAMGRNQLIGDV